MRQVVLIVEPQVFDLVPQQLADKGVLDLLAILVLAVLGVLRSRVLNLADGLVEERLLPLLVRHVLLVQSVETVMVLQSFSFSAYVGELLERVRFGHLGSVGWQGCPLLRHVPTGLTQWREDLADRRISLGLVAPTSKSGLVLVSCRLWVVDLHLLHHTNDFVDFLGVVGVFAGFALQVVRHRLWKVVAGVEVQGLLLWVLLLELLLVHDPAGRKVDINQRTGRYCPRLGLLQILSLGFLLKHAGVQRIVRRVAFVPVSKGHLLLARKLVYFGLDTLIFLIFLFH